LWFISALVTSCDTVLECLRETQRGDSGTGLQDHCQRPREVTCRLANVCSTPVRWSRSIQGQLSMLVSNITYVIIVTLIIMANSHLHVELW